MNLRDFTSFVTRDIASSTVSTHDIQIIIPNFFYENTVQMCQVRNETRGFMVGRQTNGKIIIEAFLALNMGTSTNVFPDENRFKAARKLLMKHPEIVAIDYHSHPVGTGEYWSDKFSSGDIAAFANAINVNNDYKHVLFTPTHIGTFGLKKPIVRFSYIAGINEESHLNTYLTWKNEFDSYINNSEVQTEEIQPTISHKTSPTTTQETESESLVSMLVGLIVRAIFK